MNPVYYVLGAVVVAALLTFALFPWMIKRGINMSGIFGTAGATLSTVETLAKILETASPGKFTLLNEILKYAREGVDAAEQLYKASMLAAEERKQHALDVTYKCLAYAGIDITDELKALLDEFVESSVFKLPATNVKTPKKK
jgi:hypothetical protein